MSDDVVSDPVAQLAELLGPDPDEIIAEMDARADEEGFPTVGPEVGTWLSVLVRAVDAKRIFEFGSGFGYSAYWFGRALPDDGEIVLTEIDAAELEDARAYFERGGIADRAQFERGDAIDIASKYDGPFDIVLIDNEKRRYREAIRAVEDELRPGSLVLADNALTAGTVDRDDVLALLDDAEVPDVSEASRGIAEYLQYVRTHERLETALLPLGEGVAVSVRTD